MAEQVNHFYSLDVPENIVSLCPTCHWLMHHGRAAERTSIAAKLLQRRTAALGARNIVMFDEAIRALHRTELDDDYSCLGGLARKRSPRQCPRATIPNIAPTSS
jgi:5-methylcytosine-specific restriction protein A